MSRLLSWAARFMAPPGVAQIPEHEQHQEQELGEEKVSAAPADAYPLDATGWGTCGWPL